MKNYQEKLQQHLSAYAKSRLGVYEKGKFRDREYDHILPERLKFLNLVESVRAELQEHLRAHPTIKLHQYFHHLNSSQAFAFNLFFPFFGNGGQVAQTLSAILGVDVKVQDWKFEYVPDEHEGTNVDVMWRTTDNATVFCEVKLSESGFGTATNDERHRKKLASIYRPRLQSLVSDALLEEKAFFDNYQILRNVSLLASDVHHRLIFLMPRENEALEVPLRNVLASVEANVRKRIHIAYVEDCLESLAASDSLPISLRVHAEQMQGKYLPFRL